MTAREFMQHILLNVDLDDPVQIEVRVPDNNERAYLSYRPTHVTRLGGDDSCDPPVALIDCKLIKEDVL